MTDDGITARRSFHRIWIAGKKSLVKRAPGQSSLVTKFNIYADLAAYPFNIAITIEESICKHQEIEI